MRVPEGEALYVFFKTTCPTCELLWPYLDRLRKRVGSDLEIVGVSQDAPRETAKFSREAGAEVPIVYDPPPWRASEAVGLEADVVSRGRGRKNSADDPRVSEGEARGARRFQRSTLPAGRESSGNPAGLNRA